jgi:hypothetical protein
MKTIDLLQSAALQHRLTLREMARNPRQWAFYALPGGSIGLYQGGPLKAPPGARVLRDGVHAMAEAAMLPALGAALRTARLGGGK